MPLGRLCRGLSGLLGLLLLEVVLLALGRELVCTVCQPLGTTKRAQVHKRTGKRAVVLRVEVDVRVLLALLVSALVDGYSTSLSVRIVTRLGATQAHSRAL